MFALVKFLTNDHQRRIPSFSLAVSLVAAIATIHCSDSTSPTGPMIATPALSGVTLVATSIQAGSTGHGTVSLTTAAATGGVSISLSSSNQAVATVQTPVTIQAGSTTATFAVTAVAAGTATITASLNGSSSQSPTLTVTAITPIALASISLSQTSVVGGNQVTGTVTLTGAAPTAGALVTLSGGDPVSVPVSVTVPGGSASATFPILTRAVGGTIASPIGASYGGVTISVMLSVTATSVATATFGVTGPTETDTCTLTNSGNTLDCTFNGSASTAPGTIVAWDWSYSVATTFAQTTSGPVLTMPAVSCSLLPPPPLPAGMSWFTIIVMLKVHDNLGNVSAPALNSGVRLLPQGVCGF
jgi:hypothetical protein